MVTAKLRGEIAAVASLAWFPGGARRQRAAAARPLGALERALSSSYRCRSGYACTSASFGGLRAGLWAGRAATRLCVAPRPSVTGTCVGWITGLGSASASPMPARSGDWARVLCGTEAVSTRKVWAAPAATA